ncbi:hypothetical protein Glove_91g130 [Diversispora epigaea]|uniref:Uncharacterized protein n=1 Tax=Diversispora epigaea TaxID=1348612 RepID=A0A397J5B5_9GLOM|nr:hypothetical protein Glove_91g130 [Diversispora epigaea]
MSQNSRTTLITLGFIVSELHYGPYSSYWWLISNKDQTIFPIRLGQKVKVCLNDEDFFITVQFGSGNTALLPVYYCQCGLHVVSKASPTKVISTAYKYCFNTYTRYSGYQIMDWKDKDILESLKKNVQFTPCYTGSGFQASLINTYEKKQSIFVPRFENKKCIVEIYQESVLKKQFIGKTPNEVWQQTGQLQKFTGIQLFGLDNPITKNLIQQHKIPKCILNDWNNENILQQLFNYYIKRRTIASVDWKFFFKTWNESENPVIELELSLCTIYPSGYKFSKRELEESKYQLWTKSINGQAEKVAFAALYKRGFLISIPKNMPNTTQAFWKCFEHALACNKKNSDGKKQLEQNLNVGRNTILESRKHARNEGYRAPILVKPYQLWTKSINGQAEKVAFAALYKRGFLISIPKNMPNTTQAFWKCFEHALAYTKKALWERFSEEYPNGIHRTSFMTCLERGQYVYHENLGGLCSMCNDCGYMVFGDIEVMISAHIMDNNLKKQLLRQSQELRRYIRRQYSKELEISLDGVAIHNSCISHCIQYAFGACNLDHPIICSKCKNLFHFFDKLKDILSEQYSETLDEYKQKLIAWMAHHAQELDGEGAVIIVDYKMKILPQSARETKAEFFGKRGWSLHFVLVYTKNIEQNQMNVQTFDHWSDDTRQDAWYTASYTFFETINPKPKWITIMSDNGMHYHCTELMLIISQAIKRYIKLGYDINSGDDIESAIKNIAAKLGTITGIGKWKIWSTEKIKKIIKKRKIEKPNPIYSQPSELNKLWTMPINPVLVDITNITNQEIVKIPTSCDSPSYRFFFSGWVLKENEKNKIHEPVKRMTTEIKRLLEIMFHSGTANPRQKLNAQQMYEELLRHAEIGKIEENKIPKVTTISNWITVFSHKWKEAMALRTLEENMNSENL